MIPLSFVIINEKRKSDNRKSATVELSLSLFGTGTILAASTYQDSSSIRQPGLFRLRHSGTQLITSREKMSSCHVYVCSCFGYEGDIFVPQKASARKHHNEMHTIAMLPNTFEAPKSGAPLRRRQAASQERKSHPLLVPFAVLSDAIPTTCPNRSWRLL